MKRQKRDRMTRAHSKGFSAGVSGKSSETCPFSSFETKEQWLGGWREARNELSKGYFV